MKATIDIDDTLYQQLKLEAARQGRTIRELVADGLRHVLGWPTASRGVREPAAKWYGVLNDYAGNAKGKHDLAAMRDSVAKGRRRT